MQKLCKISDLVWHFLERHAGKCYNVYDLKWHPGDNKHNSYCRQYYSESFVMFTGPLMSAVSPGETKFHITT